MLLGTLRVRASMQASSLKSKPVHGAGHPRLMQRKSQGSGNRDSRGYESLLRAVLLGARWSARGRCSNGSRGRLYAPESCGWCTTMPKGCSGQVTAVPTHSCPAMSLLRLSALIRFVPTARVCARVNAARCCRVVWLRRGAWLRSATHRTAPAYVVVCTRRGRGRYPGRGGGRWNGG